MTFKTTFWDCHLSAFQRKKNMFYGYECVKKFDKNFTNSDSNGDLL